MKTIQIACTPENWDNSTITATGMARNGRAALPKSTTAKHLPEPWLTIWHAIVRELEKLDPHGWAATFITALRQERAQEPQASAESQPPVPFVRLEIQRRWDDSTTAPPVVLDIEDAPAVELFEWLTRNEQPAAKAAI